MFDRLHYGVCYYPEHWHPSRHASDIARIADAGFNFVRLGEGAWSYWEPEEGKYQFDLFDHVIDLCRKHRVQVVMGTPTYCGPAWVAHKYPEVLRWNYNRQPMAHGSRRNYNYTSSKYIELSDKLVTALASHYKGAKQIFAWQLDNEFNCHMDVSYAPTDTLAFRGWLRDKYKTLDALNDAWGTKFWSQTYDSWDQIDLPAPTVTWHNPTQLLDETRFISDCVVRFAKRQADILRKHNKNWVITHNALFANVDGRKLTNTVLDVFSHDQYPLFNAEGDWPASAAQLQSSRSLSFPFGLLEQQSGPGGQMGYLLRTPRPGQIRLWAMQSIAHGAKLLSYFRWRTCPYGSEQHWHGLIDPDDRESRRLAEAQQLGQELQTLPTDFFDAPPARSIGVMKDFDNDANDRRINTYNKTGVSETHGWAAAAGRAHVPCDFVWPDSDWAGYKLIVCPHFKIVTPQTVAKLTAFVKAGGVLVLTAQSGLKDVNCHLVETTPPGLFRDLAGVEVQDWTTLGEKETRNVRLAGEALVPLNTFVERLQPTTADVVGTWLTDDPLLAHAPAVTRNRVGKGAVCYVAGYTAGSEPALLNYLRGEFSLPSIIEADGDVEAIRRVGKTGEYVILLNHGSTSHRVRGIGDGTDLISNTPVAPTGLLLPPFGIAVVQIGTAKTRRREGKDLNAKTPRPPR